MRFLMLSWRDPRNPKAGGAERVSQAYLVALRERGHEVYWYANDFEGCARQETLQGIQIVRGGGRGGSILKAIQWSGRQAHFDLVIDQHHGIPWLTPWWCRTNCIAYIHEVLGPIWDSFYKWPLSAIGRRQERATHWLYRKVPFWVPSESTRQALLRHGVREVKVIPNGTDTSPLPELRPKPLEQPLRLIAVSRLAPNKRVDHAIQVTRLLRQQGIDTQVTIVGTGEVEQPLKQLVSDLQISNHVTFTGRVTESEKNAHLQSAHLLVHTSLREGWGLNVIEANAMGTPAVVYPVHGLVDSTVHNETGLVTKAETPESLVDSVRTLIGKPDVYDRLRVNAWRRSKTFQWDCVLPAACAWLEQQAGRPRV